MAAPINDGSWSLWEAIVSLTSASGLFTGLGALWWLGRAQGRTETTTGRLRTDLDDHADGDKTMFAHLEGKIDGIAGKNDLRHEENLKALHAVASALAALPDKNDFRRLQERIDAAFVPRERARE